MGWSDSAHVGRRADLGLLALRAVLAGAQLWSASHWNGQHLLCAMAGLSVLMIAAGLANTAGCLTGAFTMLLAEFMELVPIHAAGFLAFALIVLSILGPGRYSADARWLGRRRVVVSVRRRR
ncbi:hypothetical protein [Caldimonas sp. KR1-144]|uniref:hypothetical protein n=1 Tax=Caldimonas sp. KR1-144 TaxID=3400911 RepID=UPI003C08772C